VIQLCIDLYCGLGGWAEGFLAEGYRVRGYDIEAHDYGTGGYPGELILADVLKLHGRDCADAAVIVGSSPCTEYSYMAMPWSRSKQIAAALRSKSEDDMFPKGYTGSRTIEQLNALFDAQFRIQREACAAAGRYIPLIVENVRGAQPWVGRAKANFGSYYLWGDVGMVGKRVVAGVPRFGVSVQPMRAVKNPDTQIWRDNGCNEENRMVPSKVAQKRNPDGTDHGSGSWFKIADSKERGAHTKNDGGSWFAVAHNTESGHSKNPVNFPNARSQEAVKVGGIDFNGEKAVGFNVTAAQRYREAHPEGSKGGGDWFGRDQNMSLPRSYGSKSNSRKAASAQIAKIPFPLAQHIARCFKPQTVEMPA
jgi:hypothetical protein